MNSRIGRALAQLLRQRVYRYFLVACAGAVVDVALFSILVFAVEVHYLWASVWGFLVATGVNYALSVVFVFSSRTRFSRLAELAVIYAVSATGLLWHQAILFAAVEFAGMHVLVAKCVALGIVFFWNYLMRRYVVFAAITGVEAPGVRKT